MYLILCVKGDRSAQWAYERLQSSGVKPLQLITDEELGYARLWDHRVGDETPSVKIGLPDGREISSRCVSGVLNRLLSAPRGLVNFAQAGDRDYAFQELTSFYLSWLETLPGSVINRPEPQGFCGRWRHTSEWALLAQKAGLPAPAYRQSANDDPEIGYAALAPKTAQQEHLIAFQGKLFGNAVDEKTREACLRFAHLAGHDLIGISLFRRDGEWNLASATPYPELTVGGNEFIQHLSDVWRGARQ